MTRRWMSLLVLLSGQLCLTVLLLATVAEAPAQAPLAPSQSPSNIASAPPEDPLFPQDIGAWTYTPEFAERFKRMKLNKTGPTGAYAVNFQVHQVDELDRCVFNLFLDNKLPIDYPEGPVGFLPFVYPGSWAFLKLSTEDQRAVETAYLAKYQEPRATLTHAAGTEPLTIFQYRTNLYPNVAVLTLTVDCNHVATMKGPLRMQLKTTGAEPHEITIPEHFPLWIDATLKKWRRVAAKVTGRGLPDHNLWSYSPEFAKRFGLPPSNEPPPTGAQAVAWRVAQYNRDEQVCFLDTYLDETMPVVMPEGEHGFSATQPQYGYYLAAKDKSDRSKWADSYSKYGDTDLFVIREISKSEQPYFTHKESLGGNLFRVIATSPLTFDQYRKQGFPRLSYISFNIGCMKPPPADLGPVGIRIARTDGQKHDVILPASFLTRVFQNWRTSVETPLKCRTPKLYPRENCDRREK